MDAFYFVKSSPLPHHLHEQQSSLLLLDAKSNRSAKPKIRRKESLVLAGKAIVQNFGLEWLSKRSVQTKISRLRLPPLGIPAPETTALPFLSSQCQSRPDGKAAKKSVFAKATHEVKKLGRKHTSKLPQEQKPEPPFADFPEKEPTRFSKTKLYNRGGFSSLEKIGLASGEFDNHEDSSPSEGQTSSRKRGWGDYAASAVAGGCLAMGFRQFRWNQQRHTNTKADFDECLRGNDPGQNCGSGGDSGGNGSGGGGDQGGDRWGPGDFSAGCEGSFTDKEVVKNDTDEEQCPETVAPDRQENHDGKDLAFNVDYGRVPFFASLSSIAGDSQPKGNFHETQERTSGITESNHSKDIQQSLFKGLDGLFPGLIYEQDLQAEAEAEKKIHSRGKDINVEPNQKSPSFLSDGDMQETSKNPRELPARSAKALHSDYTNSSLLDGSLAGGKSRIFLPVGPDEGAHMSQETDINLNDVSLLAAVQDLCDALGRSSSTRLLITEQMAKRHVLKDFDAPASQTNNKGKSLGFLTRGSQVALPEIAGSCSQTAGPSFTSNTTSRALDSSGHIEVSPAIHLCRRSADALCWLTSLVHSVTKKKIGEEGKSFNEGGEATEPQRKALVDEIVSLTVKQLLQTDGSTVIPKCSETEALRRLQREAFLDLLKIRERLDKIEQTISSRHSRNLGRSSGVSRTQLKGEVKAGTAVVILEDSNSRHARSSLEQAGMQSGLDMRFTFETSFRERDLLVTQCVAGQGSSVGDGRALGGPISLGKVWYSAHINNDISISVIPLGAQGKDVTEIVNPLQDQALTEFASNGPALFSQCKGSAMGATVTGLSFALSVAQFLSGWDYSISAFNSSDAGSDPLCLSTLGQFLFQPSEHTLFSLSGLNRYWPTPPLPSSVGLHWSEMGPLIIPKIHSRQTRRSTAISPASTITSVSYGNNLGFPWDASDIGSGTGILESKGISMQSVALSGEMELAEHVSIGGWAQVECGDWLHSSGTADLQWALNLAKNSGSIIDWGISIGGSSPDFWSMASSDQEGYPGYSGRNVGDSSGSQLQLEAFLRMNCGKGFTLQPGLLYVLNKHSYTPALMLRSSWAM